MEFMSNPNTIFNCKCFIINSVINENGKAESNKINAESHVYIP